MKTLILSALGILVVSTYTSCGRNSDGSTSCTLVNQNEEKKKESSALKFSGDTDEVATSDCAGGGTPASIDAVALAKLTLEGETEVADASSATDDPTDTSTTTVSASSKPTEYSVVGESLIINGSFENNNLKAKSWKVLKSIEGWTTSAGAGIEVQKGVAGSAHDGNSKIELDSHGSKKTNSTMFQEIKTAANTYYRLSFAYSPRPKVSLNSNKVEVLWNGTVVSTLAENGKNLSETNWTVHTMDLAGVGGKSKLEFRAAGSEDTFGGYIDSVSVYALVAKVEVPFDPASVAPIIIDNDAATVVGDWEASKVVTGFEGQNYIHNRFTDSANKAVYYDFQATHAGYWTVYAKWTQHSNRATNVAYNIFHPEGRARVVVNQKVNGGVWNELGTFRFSNKTGEMGQVMISGSQDYDGYVIADAVKFVYVGLTAPSYALSSPISLDNNDSRYVSVIGSWQHSSVVKQFDGSDYLHDDNRLHTDALGANISESKQVIYAPDFAKAGKYKVYVKWTSHPNRASNAVIVVNYNGGQERFVANQKVRGGEYIEMGSFDFKSGRSTTGGSVVIQRPDNADGYVIADSVKFVLAE